MDETVILWIFGAVIALQTTIVGGVGLLLWKHVERCSELQSDIAEKLGAIGTIPQEVQNLRRRVHDLHNDVMKLNG